MALNPIVDSRDVRFVLFEMLEVDAFTKLSRFSDFDKDMFEDTLTLAENIAVEQVYPANEEADKEGVHYNPDTKEVTVPACIKPGLAAYHEAGFIGLANDPEIGGMGMPEAIYDHRYVFSEIGYNLKPLELQGSIGLQQLNKLPEMDKARRRNFDRLNSIFSKYSKYFHMPEATEGADPCWFAYLLTVRDNAPFTKSDIVNFFEANKIQTRSYFSGNVLAHPAYNDMASEYGDIQKTFPVATKITLDSFFLGTFIGITDQQMNYIEEVVDNFFKKIK